jgi:hypothetical protein
MLVVVVAVETIVRLLLLVELLAQAVVVEVVMELPVKKVV